MIAAIRAGPQTHDAGHHGPPLHFCLLTDALPEPMFWLSADGIIEAANRAARTLFSVQGEELAGLPFWHLTTDPTATRAWLRQCLFSSNLTPGRLSLVSGKGTVEQVHAEAAAVRPPDGERRLLLRLPGGQKLLEKFVELDRQLGELSLEVARRRAVEQELKESHDRLQVLNRQLQEMASRDYMTGVLNRRAFTGALQQVWQQAIQRGDSLSIFLLDIDYFKRYNDHCGHLAGDRCLQRVARAISGALEPDALVARFGGEEFIALLPQSDDRSARAAMDSIFAGVRELAIPHPGSPLGPIVTLSAGICTRIPRPGGKPFDQIRLADQSLYAAKREGRNRYVVAGDPPATRARPPGPPGDPCRQGLTTGS